MPQDYGAAEPLVGPYMRSMRKAEAVYDRLGQPVFPKRQDTSWHEDMVRKANDSFRQQAEKDAAAKASGAARQPTKRSPKRAPARPAAGKRR